MRQAFADIFRGLIHPVRMSREPLTPSERKTLVRVAVVLAIPLALIVLIPTLVGFTLFARESRARTDQNKTLIQRIAADDHQIKQVLAEQSSARQRNRERFASSDRTLCMRIEALKTQVRASVAFDETAIRQTLVQLGINPDSSRGQKLIAQQRAASAVLVERFQAKSCTALPSAKATEPKA